MSTPTPEPTSGLVPAPADDPGVLASAVIGHATADIRKAFASRSGMTEDEPMNVILDRLVQVLADIPEPPPEGAELVDSATLADLRREAEAGRTTRVRQVLATAIRDGRMRPADRYRWEHLLTLDFEAAAAMVKALPVVIPVAPLGYSTDPEGKTTEDELYASVFGDEPT